MKTLLVGVLALSAWAQSIPFPGPGMPASGGGASPAELNCGVPSGAHCKWAVASSGGTTVAISPPVNSTGGVLVVLYDSEFGTSAAGTTVTDVVGGTCTALSAPANTWHFVANRAASNVNSGFWYSFLTSTGAGHTFCTSNFYGSHSGAIFTGPISAFDTQGGATGTGITSLGTGSITPGAANCLIVTGAGTDNNAGNTFTVAVPYTLLSQVPTLSANNEGSALAWYVTGSATSTTWNVSGTDDLAVGIVSFK